MVTSNDPTPGGTTRSRPGREPKWADWLLAAGAVLVAIVGAELGLRATNTPELIISGLRPADAPPVNELGWRGRPIRYDTQDFVVVLVGDSQVSCAVCPADETMDLILENALRAKFGHVRVVSLGAASFGQDREYLALEEYFARYRADLVVNWLTVGNDVWNNTFRTPSADLLQPLPKPSFWLEGSDLRGPSEQTGTPVYWTRVENLLHHVWHLLHHVWYDFEAEWARHLPPPDAGTKQPAAGLPIVDEDREDIANQRTHWSILLDPPPARVRYGINLTRALFARMRDLARGHGADFVILATNDFTPQSLEQGMAVHARFFLRGTVAIGHGEHWYVAREGRYREVLAELTAGFATATVPIDIPNPRIGPQDLHLAMPANRAVMARIAAYIATRHPVGTE